MKKQKITIGSLKLKKVHIARLHAVKGAYDPQQAVDITLKTFCCSRFPYCLPTIATRPDSLNPSGHKATINSGD